MFFANASLKGVCAAVHAVVGHLRRRFADIKE